MGKREFSALEVLTERPRGEVLHRDNLGVLWECFICHGCQMCWPENEGDEEAYPHIISSKAVIEVTW